MTDQTQVAPTTQISPNLLTAIRLFFFRIITRKPRQTEKPYKPVKHFSAGLSPDGVAFDWGHMQNHDGDRFRRF